MDGERVTTFGQTGTDADRGDAAPACEAPATPPFCRAEMPDQQIVIWTPLRLMRAFFRAFGGPVVPARLISRVDDGA